MKSRKSSPIVTKSINRQIYTFLKDKIIKQEYPPGTRIDPQKLGEKLKVSITPLKNAFKVPLQF